MSLMLKPNATDSHTETEIESGYRFEIEFAGGDVFSVSVFDNSSWRPIAIAKGDGNSTRLNWVLKSQSDRSKIESIVRKLGTRYGFSIL